MDQETITTAQALKLFEALARQKGLDLASDGTRFLRLTTAKKWTAYHAKHTSTPIDK